MSIALSEARNDIYRRLDDTHTGFWTPEELDAWIYDAATAIARETECLWGEKSYTTEVGRSRYPLPSNMLRAHRLEYRRSDQIRVLEWRPIMNMDDVWWTGRGEQGTVGWWTITGWSGVEGGALEVYPAPSEVLPDGLWLGYYRLPTRPTEHDDPIEIPAGWEDLIPLYVEINALRKAGSPRWREAYELYSERIGQMVALTRHQTDQGTLITGSRFMPSWANEWDW